MIEKCDFCVTLFYKNQLFLAEAQLFLFLNLILSLDVIDQQQGGETLKLSIEL